VSYFAVIREAGPAWEAGGIFQQPSVTEHAANAVIMSAVRIVLIFISYPTNSAADLTTGVW